MIRRPPRSTPKPSSAASDVYKRQLCVCVCTTFGSSLPVTICTVPSASPTTLSTSCCCSPEKGRGYEDFPLRNPLVDPTCMASQGLTPVYHKDLSRPILRALLWSCWRDFGFGYGLFGGEKTIGVNPVHPFPWKTQNDQSGCILMNGNQPTKNVYLQDMLLFFYFIYSSVELHIMIIL